MRVLDYKDELYPKRLLDIEDYPKRLYVEGNVELLNNKAVAIIGSRHSTEYGEYYAKKFSEELSKAGVCITSGLALGIDSMAHVGAMKNKGKTIAVLGSGLENIFPYRNRGLFKSIIDNGGCVISEYEPDTVADSPNFPRRNRIVSGLSIAVLVIESVYRSGTSITAKFAKEQGRTVFCIPHNLGEKNGVGTNQLIKEGASLVTCSDDILLKLGLSEVKKTTRKRKKDIEREEIFFQSDIQKIDIDDKYLPVYNELSYEPINVEVLYRNLKLPVNEVNYALTLLELSGYIQRNAGNQIVLKNR